MLNSGSFKMNLLRRFRHDHKGIAAVEFAMILPVMIAMFFGMAELSLAVSARSSVSQLASTVADLVAQSNAPTGGDISNVYRAANTIMFPYFPNFDSRPPTIRITSVIYNAAAANPARSGRVAWSCRQTGSGTLTVPNRAVNSTMTFGNDLLTVGGSVLVAEIAYNYASPTTKMILGSYNMQDVFYTKPRRVAQIPPPACP